MLKNKKYTRSSKNSVSTPKKLTKKLVLAGALVLTLIAAGVTYMLMQKPSDANTATGNYQKTSTGHDVNLDPPTEEDKQQTDQNKEELGGNPTPTPPAQTDDGKKSVTPFIVYIGTEDGNAVVSGYVGGIFEEGGTCTATFTKGSLKVVKTSQGFQDSNHTTCAPLKAPLSEFAQSGNWGVVLSYSSKTASGTSLPGSVEIP